MSYQNRQEVIYTEKTKLVAIHPSENRSSFIRIEPSSYPFKRLFDIVVALFVIVLILSWLLPILAILIKLDSKGPVFFIQKRVGAFGKIFRCIKLRTMVVNAEANLLQAQANDPRITTFGKFLRISCMDELPQFFNVLIGDMSVVGPRPHMIRDCTEFSKVVKHYNNRYSVKPGITGMAQIKGYRGNTKNFFDVSHRYKWDMFYVKNRNLSLDLKILAITVTSTVSSVYTSLTRKSEKEAVYNIESEYLIETPECLN